MIRLLVRLGTWLDARFPEKVTVTAANYEALNTELSLVRSELKDNQLSLIKALERLSVVEQYAVHKNAVVELINTVKDVKLEYASLKASMGFTPLKDAEIQAMLNGEAI